MLRINQQLPEITNATHKSEKFATEVTDNYVPFENVCDFKKEFGQLFWKWFAKSAILCILKKTKTTD